MQVQVTLAESDQFAFRSCDGCQYSVCLCGEESRTFSWIVTPAVLGTGTLIPSELNELVLLFYTRLIRFNLLK